MNIFASPLSSLPWFLKWVASPFTALYGQDLQYFSSASTSHKGGETNEKYAGIKLSRAQSPSVSDCSELRLLLVMARLYLHGSVLMSLKDLRVGWVKNNPSLRVLGWGRRTD